MVNVNFNLYMINILIIWESALKTNYRMIKHLEISHRRGFGIQQPKVALKKFLKRENTSVFRDFINVQSDSEF